MGRRLWWVAEVPRHMKWEPTHFTSMSLVCQLKVEAALIRKCRVPCEGEDRREARGDGGGEKGKMAAGCCDRQRYQNRVLIMSRHVVCELWQLQKQKKNPVKDGDGYFLYRFPFFWGGGGLHFGICFDSFSQTHWEGIGRWMVWTETVEKATHPTFIFCWLGWRHSGLVIAPTLRRGCPRLTSL